MFCRNCGNKLADNAKFCGLCGNPVVRNTEPQPEEPIIEEPAPVPEPVTASEPAPSQEYEQYQQTAPQPQPIPEPEPAPIPQPTPIPQQFEQNYQQYDQNYQQPSAQPYQQTGYAQPYQQPMSQPFPQQGMPQQTAVRSSASGKIIGFVMMLCSIFFVCTLFIKCYSVLESDFSVFGNLQKLAEVADDHDKNFVSYMSDLIGSSPWYGAAFYIGMLLNVLFDVLAVVMIIFAFVRLASKDSMSEIKMWSDIKASVIFGFLGSFSMFVCILIANIFNNLKIDLGIFDEWGCVPGVLMYVFLAAEIVVIVVCGIMKSRARKAVMVSSPSYTAPPIPPFGTN